MAFQLDAGRLTFAGQVLLSDLPKSISLDPDAGQSGVFLRASTDESGSRRLFSAGKVPRLLRFTACHRYEPYWMKPAAGTLVSKVPAETQFLLARLDDGSLLLLVPLLDDPARFSLRGKPDGSLELLAETGDAHTLLRGGRALYVMQGDDLFAMMRQGASEVGERLGFGPLRTEKAPPEFVDQFGWCTWDAFYQEVSADKVREGLESFKAGGVSPRMMILDDGWQSVRRMPTSERRLAW